MSSNSLEVTGSLSGSCSGNVVLVSPTLTIGTIAWVIGTIAGILLVLLLVLLVLLVLLLVLLVLLIGTDG